MLEVEVRKLKHARRRQEEFFLQHRLSPTQSPELKSFAEEILQIVEKGISRLQDSQPAPRGPSTVGSRLPSTFLESEVRLPVTPPLTPPHKNDRDQTSEVEPEAEVISTPRQKVRRRRTRSEPPVSLINSLTLYPKVINHSQQNISPLSPSHSFLGTVAEAEDQNEGSPEQELHGQKQDRGNYGVYVQVPPVGSLKFGPRPKAGRTSPDSFSPSASRLGRQEDTPQRQSRPHSYPRRRHGSKTSVYGNGGEVTPYHLTGFIGLPPGKGKGRKEESQ